MELRHLRYFLAVAQERNFSRAAERLNIAQPPLSRQIRQLELEVGAELFDRGSRPLRLTEAGRLLHQHAQQVLSGFDQMCTMMTRYAGAQSRRFIIGFVGSVIYGRLPRIVRLLRAALGDAVEVTLTELSTLDQIAALREGRIDAGFGRLRIDDPAVRRIVMLEEPLVAALPADHILAEGEDPLELAALAAEPLILYPRPSRPSYADQLLSLFQDHGLVPESRQEVRELQTALGMVAAGAGLCVVPASVQSLHRDDLVYRPIAAADAVSPIILSHRAGDEASDLLELIAISRDIYGDAGS
ncbi:LysR family transcriptional regulator [Sphingomonas colocasiae]|uniref:LysR family transcriptional regulator n=1 Tax=Sphingomonas colocasiae TaxID=1848973 RepID=A0ABS7PWI1_9SPHN|nr:LysR family transcriptional regulator [Sphingomonas colocasiae]MBY8825717.1 LysR family transcriptional regulator [Sphingomonas colocasiae]